MFNSQKTKYIQEFNYRAQHHLKFLINVHRCKKTVRPTLNNAYRTIGL